MKKIYTLVGIFAISLTGVAQNIQSPTAKGFHLEKEAKIDLKKSKATADGIEKAPPLWSEDFANGLTGNNTSTVPTWTVVTSGNPLVEWTYTTVGHTGAYPTQALASTTSSNGWMIVDSDAYGDVSNTENSDLISPIIDLTGQTDVMVTFEQMMREYQNDVCTVSVTTDGWTTQTDYIINDGIGGAGTPNPDLKAIIISNAIAASPSTVQVKFNWQGAWDYGWQIDDVSIEVVPDYEVALSSPNFMTDAYNDFGIKTKYSMVPTGQETSTMFVGILSNNGIMDATNAYLNVEVLDPSSNSVFTGTDDAGMPTLTNVTTQNDSVYSYVPNAGAGQYRFNYSIAYDNLGSDANTSNNTATDSITIGGNYYALDNNDYSGYYNIGDNPIAFNCFDIETTTTIYGVSIALGSSTVADLIVYPYILEVDPLAAAIADYPIVFDGAGGFDEYLVPSNELTSGGNLNWINLPINQGNGVTLNAGKAYLIGFAHYAASGDTVALLASSDQPDFGSLFNDPAQSPPWTYTISATTIRANFDASIGIKEENNVIARLGNYPNPFADETNVSFSLTESAHTTITIVDITGKVVKTMDLGTLSTGDHLIQVDASELSSGVYHFTLTSGEFSATDKMIINK